nr:putative rad60/SUMO-like domain, ubiquitin-related domain protein [Tanacetum cinerariifolium]
MSSRRKGSKRQAIVPVTDYARSNHFNSSNIMLRFMFVMIGRSNMRYFLLQNQLKQSCKKRMLKRDLKSSMDTASKSLVEKPSKPAAERSKIVISIQDKDDQKQFRVYTVLLKCWSGIARRNRSR